MSAQSDFDHFRTDLASLQDSFNKRQPYFKSEGYDEAQLRTDFLNPFWRALGWDVENRSRQPQSLRDVQVETRVNIAGRKKRADYVFRTDGVARFVCEAKTPTDSLTRKDAFQVQRYAFNLKVYLTVLTNFECLQIFIVGGRPEESDPFRVFRQWDFRQFSQLDREIWDLLSRECVAAHSIDKLVDGLKKRPIKGKTREGWLFVPERVRTVDDEFLEYVERQREDLARILIEHNPKVKWTDAALNDCIQRIIDRILFVRICEDRDIDTGRSLESIVDEWKQISVAPPTLYSRFVAHFNSLDIRFNGTLFHRGHLSESLNVADDFLVEMIQDLSNEDSPYLFSTLPVEILGSVYERFIGKVVRLTHAGNVKIELKPEVRKAGGVYYTPKFVVDYIVEHTAGLLVVGKDPSVISKLRILDPACGSGSFLLRVFERICDEHCFWFESNVSKQRKELCYEDESGVLHLTPHLKRQIMMDNVYGVDIDPRAVEVTMLSLYLKILEGETRTTLGRNFNLFPKETFLPDLSANIKCGNSLISSDFYSGEQLSMLAEAEIRDKVNAFDWDTEFNSVMQNGKFDTVLGNPPYVLLQDEFRDDAQLDYFRRKYQTAQYKIDTYHLFMERGIQLTRTGGRCAMITPANFLTNNYLAKLRRFLLDETTIDHILVIDGGVFHGVSVDNAIFVLTKVPKTTGEWPLIHVLRDDDSFREVSRIKVQVATGDKDALFTGSRGSTKLWDGIVKLSVRLGQISYVNFGKQLRDRSKFLKDVIELGNRKLPSGYKRCYTGRDIDRYNVRWNGLACLDKDMARRGGCWDGSRQNTKNKLLTRQIGRYPTFALDSKGYQCLNTIFMINVHGAYDPYYILAVLNSKLVKAFWIDRYFDQRRTFPKIKGTYLEEIPIFSTADPDKEEEEKMAQIAELGKLLGKLHAEINSVDTGGAATRIKRQIDSAGSRIDKLLYSLFGLSEPQISQIDAIADAVDLPAETLSQDADSLNLKRKRPFKQVETNATVRKRKRRTKDDNSGVLFR